MNLYTLHNNPEELYGYQESIKIPKFAYEMALVRHKKTKKRSPDLEPAIGQDPLSAYWYASGFKINS